jgi:hypothetical protein
VQQPQGNWREGFGRRAGYYLMGIAIGLVMLGLFQYAKQRARQAQAAERAAPAPSTAPAAGSTRPATEPPASK